MCTGEKDDRIYVENVGVFDTVGLTWIKHKVFRTHEFIFFFFNLNFTLGKRMLSQH